MYSYVCTVLSRGAQSLFGPTRKSFPWGNFFDGGLNQSIKRRLSWWTFWLIDWLIDHKLTLTWLVYWTRTTRSVFTGAGLKWPNITGQYSTVVGCRIVYGRNANWVDFLWDCFEDCFLLTFSSSFSLQSFGDVNKTITCSPTFAQTQRCLIK